LCFSHHTAICSLRYCICAIEPHTQQYMRGIPADECIPLPAAFVADISAARLAKRITRYLYQTVCVFVLCSFHILLQTLPLLHRHVVRIFNGETRPTADAQRRVFDEIMYLRNAQCPSTCSLGASSEWWIEQRRAMPVLYLLARIAAITPLSTVPVEQLFGVNRE
jgi:hypothetical protein